MARYKLMVEADQEEAPTGEIEEISVKKMVELAASKQLSHLLDNKIAVKGTVKIKKFIRKFQVNWQNAKTNLYHQRSYVAFVAKNGAIRVKGVGSTLVTQEAPEESA